MKNQTFTNWECIVVDDGGSDNTSRVVQDFSTSNSRFIYLERPKSFPKGASGSRNFGFSNSKGRYVQWLDDDDLLSPNKIELQVERLEKEENQNCLTTCDWDVYWPAKEFESRNVVYGEERLDINKLFTRLTKRQSFVPAHAYLTPRTLIEKAGVWNTDLSINDDAEFFSRIILKSNALITTSGCHVLYRMHQGERLSGTFNSHNLGSLIYSYRLIHAHLKNAGIENKKFFKWKLLKILLFFWKSDKKAIEFHKSFFAENGINVMVFPYHFLRFELYKILMPWYKRRFK